ncbi:MAG: FG-GAP repeat domain-containing protein, partial [Thermodesulfobacteriota bacterium]
MAKNHLTKTVVQKDSTVFGQTLSHGILRAGAMAASVAGCVFLASPAHQALAAPGPFLFHGIEGNPLPMPVGASAKSRPTLVDIDADGDIDIFVGDKAGTIAYFENTGTALTPAFEMRTGADNPFWNYEIEYYLSIVDKRFSTPTFADLDNDGDLDAGVGNGFGEIDYFENIGTVSTPAFVMRAGADSPFWYYDTGCGDYYSFALEDWFSTPTFADLDGDGDFDVFVSSTSGMSTSIRYFENTGTASAPLFLGTSCGPLYSLTSSLWSPAAAFADIDGDGDMDAFVGSKYQSYGMSSGILGSIFSFIGGITYFENIGNASAPQFASDNPNNPFAGLETDLWSVADFADIDGDGDLDAFVGGMYGDLEFFENTGTVNAPVMTRRQTADNPAWGVDVGKNSHPAFVDIDGDGDLDGFVGEYGVLNGVFTYGSIINLQPAIYGSINFFKNTGTAQSPHFVQRADADNGLGEGVLGPFETYSAPAFVDIDGDGDMDMFMGARYGFGRNVALKGEPPGLVTVSNISDPAVYIQYFRNVGTQTAPYFVAMPPEKNPAATIEAGNRNKPAFMDADNDGDSDLFIGNGDGDIYYFENTGTATAAEFNAELPEYEINPFGLQLDETIDSYSAAPTFADTDGDGDMDACVGVYYGAIH